MKLLIGGKSRNIYMRKDGSAYYKSGGQQVDITHMFKKNGGGLKKKYIKGGTTEENFNKLKAKCIELYEKLKELHDKLNGHNFSIQEGENTKEFISNIVENYDTKYNLKELADEINKAVTEGYTNSAEVAENYKKLIEQLKKVSENINYLVTSADDGGDTIKTELNEIYPKGGVLEVKIFFEEKKQALLEKLKFFDKVIEEIKKIGKESKTETKKTDDAEETDDANGVTISTTVPKISALSKFSGNIEDFDQEFLDLAHLLISVINTLRKNSKIIMKSENPDEIKKQVKKLNALITLFEMSDKNATTNKGVFLINSFIKAVINVKRTSVFLEIKSKENEYSVSRKGESLNDEKIFKIFSVIGEICKLNSTNLAYGISKKLVAQNLRDFLQSDDHAVIEITNSKESKKSVSD